MVKRVNHEIKGWILVKVLPLWFVNLMNLFGLPRFLSDFYAWDGHTLTEVIEDLQLLLAYSWGTYGTLPSRTSFAMQALIHYHYEEVASYPIGGSSEIPYRIIPVIERSGGQVFMKATVLKILTKEGRAMGVRVGHKESSAVNIYVPIVISDAGILNTFLDLLPEEVSKTSPLWPLIDTLKSGIGLHQRFTSTAEELGLRAENLWIFTDSSSEGLGKIFDGTTLDDVLYKSYPGFFIGCHSAKDPSWERRYPGRSTITVLTFAPYSWFAQWENLSVKKRGDEYNSLKNAIGQQIIDQIIHLYPHLQNAIEFFSVGTPITNQHYLNAKAGATYGLDHGFERFSPKMVSFLRPGNRDRRIISLRTGRDVAWVGVRSAFWRSLCQRNFED
uniref:Amine oxidase domain-containing protein n=1 Tax=Daphnia galeata TaxID=27404 RepID=A0A8J2RE32_9CRUS|nr:unnamed protein product [Daphnia galeata]